MYRLLYTSVYDGTAYNARNRNAFALVHQSDPDDRSDANGGHLLCIQSSRLGTWTDTGPTTEDGGRGGVGGLSRGGEVIRKAALYALTTSAHKSETGQRPRLNSGVRT
ncbi:Hypothetical protein NTJ_14133 [Nesidiocoris tenuis]|uniref:Uncharacterized protein n=1 Tax=Nesidiocoris tenuis TaxID=355587 RepID=A0ABN7BAC0_9HEMI|nr:Hypothetical protein NTJ_14133 [Nesidiocoris tenuis]